METTKKQNIRLIIAFIAMLIVHVFLAFFVHRDQTIVLFSSFGLLFIFYVYLYRFSLSKKQLYALLGGALALRFVWLFGFPQLSDDYARFVWDGRLIIAGFNPFKYLPSEIMKHGFPANCIDPMLYKVLNSQQYYTCYPPLLQSIFAFSAWLFPHNIYGNIIVLKSFNLIAEVGSTVLLVKLCAIWNIDKKHSMLYVLNPVVIAELTGNLHYEGVMIFSILGMIYCLQKGRIFIAILACTAAIITKLIPLMFLPFIFFFLGWKKGVLFCVGVLAFTLLSWLPFYDLSIIQKFWSSINSYFQESEFNASIYYLVRDITYHFTNENKIEIIGPVLTIFSGFIILIIAFLNRKNKTFIGLITSLILAMLSYYAFTTTVFPWYLTPMIALCIFTPYRFPIVWSCVVMLSYYANRTLESKESNLLIWIEYLVVAIALINDFIVWRKNHLAEALR